MLNKLRKDKTMKTTIELDSYEACRTNTGRAIENFPEYNMEKLTLIGLRCSSFEEFFSALKMYAKEGNDEWAIEDIKKFAQALLSAYEIQRDSYKH